MSCALERLPSTRICARGWSADCCVSGVEPGVAHAWVPIAASVLFGAAKTFAAEREQDASEPAPHHDPVVEASAAVGTEELADGDDDEDATLEFLAASHEREHQFELRFGGGLVDGDLEHRLDGRTELHAEILAIPSFEQPGYVSSWVTGIAQSRLDVEGAIGRHGLRDFHLGLALTPLGYYAHRLREGGVELRGVRALVGATIGVDYAAHAYPSPESSPLDSIAAVHAGGLVADFRWTSARAHVRTGLDLRPVFAALRSLVSPSTLVEGGNHPSGASVARDQEYFLAGGLTIAPMFAAGLDRWSLGGQAGFEMYWGVDVGDLQGRGLRHDRRAFARTHVSYAPVQGLDLRVALERRSREGWIDGIHAARSEWAIVTSAGLAF